MTNYMRLPYRVFPQYDSFSTGLQGCELIFQRLEPIGDRSQTGTGQEPFKVTYRNLATNQGKRLVVKRFAYPR
jgi:hypothetical protein